jgi:hypothetical protein
VDCVIKIIRGPDEGQQFQCSGTEAVVGRSPRSQVRLTSPAASYEHAIISRNGDEFFIENLSAAGTFVNDERITGKVRLRARDQLRFGPETVARVEAVPTSGSSPGRRRALLFLFIAVMAALLILVVADPFSASTPQTSSRASFAKLDAWTQSEVEQQQLPLEAQQLLREAWRLETSGDRTASVKVWRRLAVLLASQQNFQNLDETSRKYATALQRLESKQVPPPKLADDEMAAALVQFVARMSRAK